MENPAGPHPVEPGLESLVELAEADLAQRLSISADQVDLLEARAVVRPKSAVGCPQPGMRYRQIPQDGALIRFSAEGRTHSCHLGARRGTFLCQQGTKGPPGSPQPDELAPPLGSGDV
jgi:hypothetical protein